jgi:H+/Cl- antiporter ClcA
MLKANRAFCNAGVMNKTKRLQEYFLFVLKWALLAIPVALVAGSLVALFLWLLDLVTTFRAAHTALLYLLPLAGLLIHFLYRVYGGRSEAGNNLVIEEIHEPGAGVPARMAPLVLFTTVVTHLFGGSAGREGTAVQMGGSMAAWLARRFHLPAAELRIMLQCGIAAGFGAVFGTPLAATIFALEVLVVGRMRYDALLPCLFAAVLADRVTAAWGIQHAHYHIAGAAATAFPLHAALLLPALLGGIASGLAALAFVRCVHAIKDGSARWTRKDWLIPFIGGVVLVVLAQLPGAADYLGLGTKAMRPGGAAIDTAFTTSAIDPMAWCWKLLFTAITLGTGFKGGEVTPLFFIGATLGHSLALYFGFPVDLMAGLCFIAVFAGAANTPIACTIMGAELFGYGYLLYYALACIAAYWCSGNKGIYSAQRRHHRKTLS